MSASWLPPIVQGCLERLTVHRGLQAGQPEHFERIQEAVRQQLLQVELVHGVSTIEQLSGIVRDKVLKSKASLGLSGSPAQMALQTDTAVCTSPGYLYPRRTAALIFRYTAETVPGRQVEATPFDSGAFHHRRICPKVEGDALRQALYRSWCLPAPAYREYMVARVASCFESVEAWRKGEPACFNDPDEILCLEEPSGFTNRVFEVRFEKLLQLDEHLVAVFLPYRRGDVRLRGMRGALDTWEDLGVEIVYVNVAEETSLSQQLYEWFRRQTK